MKKVQRGYRKARYVVYKQTILNPIDHLWTFIGGFLGIGAIAYIQSELHRFGVLENVFLIGSFGASAVLVYGATNSPLAQPRNLIFGHTVSAFVGVLVMNTVGNLDIFWLTCAVAVSLAIIAMQILKALHPPGGATALIAVIGTPKIQKLGFLYVLSPVFTGALILLIIALLVNNIPKDRHYPYNPKVSPYMGRRKKYWLNLQRALGIR
ncbi:HPP family protein [Echinicola vietnamensis]|uniref:CBS-domain-containing membrane protein n=1 Tax=Echinicola vietnamensis (strain DSM 17526 / LMG 23754 / KMM 6221) TaxID=926556 RepID=L0G4P6_ECHVK|nr:HPP family protein [Echinicola vietnamensis]AGA79986.1 CBS-domain-containing membrane protein [Echinicola vietnamensis DSM 17526]